jgi:thiol-disulfide isomerase/thioredoxin
MDFLNKFSNVRSEYMVGGTVLVLLGFGFLTLSFTQKDILSIGEFSRGAPYAEIVSPSGFVNNDAFTLADLVGKKVILLDFMTYSCINCQRTFPYLIAWYEKYKADGLEIVGIHTPEFAFEKNIENVRQAMESHGIVFPIVLDNEYATWRAYGNNYWPHKYLIDIHGNIIYDHIGEGEYEETERQIQKALQERAQVLGLGDAMEQEALISERVLVKGPRGVKSPEVYFGSKRNDLLKNGRAKISGEQSFVLPEHFTLNALYLGGKWQVTEEFVESEGEAVVVFRYHAKEVHLVAEADRGVTIEVLQDGIPVTDAKGSAVRFDSTVHIGESRLYNIIHNASPGEHVLELRIKGAGVRLYTFTFG